MNVDVDAAIARALDAQDQQSRCSQSCYRYRQLVGVVRRQRTVEGRRDAKRRLAAHVLAHQPSTELIEL